MVRKIVYRIQYKGLGRSVKARISEIKNKEVTEILSLLISFCHFENRS